MNIKFRTLPYFPLSVFLYPGEDIPLRIFEPRYLQLIKEAKDADFTFAIPFVLENERQSIGCEVKLQQVIAEGNDGQMVVSIESIRFLKIVSYSKNLKGKLYDGGLVEDIQFSDMIENEELVNLLINYTEQFDQSFSDNFTNDGLNFSNVIKALNLSSEDKFHFFNLKKQSAKEKYLMHQLYFLMLIRKQEQLLDNDFQLN